MASASITAGPSAGYQRSFAYDTLTRPIQATITASRQWVMNEPAIAEEGGTAAALPGPMPTAEMIACDAACP